MHRMCNGLPWMNPQEEINEFSLFWERARTAALEQGLRAMSGGGVGEVSVSGEGGGGGGGGIDNHTSNPIVASKRDLYGLSQQQRQHLNNNNNNNNTAMSSATGYTNTYPPHSHPHGPVRDPYASRVDPQSQSNNDHREYPPSSPSSPPAVMKRPNRDPYAQYYETKNDDN